MTDTVRFSRPRSRLSRLIDLPGGLTVAVALRHAEANLELLREPALCRIGEDAAALQAFGRPTSVTAAQALEAVYDRATAIIDCASPFGLEDVCAVAAGLCDLAKDVSPDRPFDWRVPTVSGRTMALLLSLPVDAYDQRRRVREGIEAILARKLSPRD